MKTLRTVRYASGFTPVVFLLLLICFPASVYAEDEITTEYFAGICGSTVGDVGYRTVFKLINATTESRWGELDLFQGDGSPMDAKLDYSWAGSAGSYKATSSKAEFEIPAKSVLVIILGPVRNAIPGWARLQSKGGLTSQAEVQVGTTHQKGPGFSPEFGHHVQQVATLSGAPAGKRYTFPVWFFMGFQNVGTMFSVVNLAAVPSTVAVTFDSGVSKKVRLNPGQSFVDFFDHFWQMAFPLIFPFELRGVAEVESVGPIGLAVLQTLNGLPASGVEVAPSVQEEVLIKVPLDTEFLLNIGQTGEVEGTDLKLNFWNVVQDSRCPSDVVCVWEGRVGVEVDATLGDKSGRLTLWNTSEAGSATFGGYKIRLVEVLPVPVSLKPTDISAYQLVLLVTNE